MRVVRQRRTGGRVEGSSVLRIRDLVCLGVGIGIGWHAPKLIDGRLLRSAPTVASDTVYATPFQRIASELERADQQAAAWRPRR